MDSKLENTMSKEQKEILEAWKLILADRTIGADFKELSEVLNAVNPEYMQKVTEMLILSFYLGIENA